MLPSDRRVRPPKELVLAPDPPVRDRATRIRDARARLEQDADCWVATSLDDRPWLVPLSFRWTGDALLLATPKRNRTYQGVAAGGGLRVALGTTRDVVMIDGEVDRPAHLPADEADAVAARTGVDPRSDPDAGYLRLVPRRIQVWRNPQEVPGRTIMRDGYWLESAAR